MDSKHDSFGFLMADAARAMRRAFKQRLQGSCLTQAQARALVHVSRNQGIRQVDLSEILEVRPITLARLLDQLAAAGTVERRVDPADRRVFRIFLTTQAKPHLAAIDKVAHTIRADALRDVSPQEAETLQAALRKIHDNLSTL